MRDGTVIWTSPAGDTYVTHPGSAYLFPGLCGPTETVTVTDPGAEPRGDRTAMMPRRSRTREKQCAADIAAERHRNHQSRTTIHTSIVDEYETQYAINYGLMSDPPF